MRRPLSPETAEARSRLGLSVRYQGPESEAAQQARRDLKAAKLADHIKRVVDAAPPLTSEQRSRLAGLLTPARQQRGQQQ
ncbi:hypothetical protein [uncultured Modestobacter sp.]|uniref:hypothetical protein n=1 Tax=uncultured Modestobacter sp. TaxID=380048 RepID=UPI00262DECC6|nr:hypothetical protein [uncultured Modestobacter sp.]